MSNFAFKTLLTPALSNQYKIIDLTYLLDIAGDNKSIIKEMITIFVSQVPEFIEEMNSCYKKNDWYNLSMIAHKAKSSVAIMGMNSQANALKDLELLAKDQKNIDKYEGIINQFTADCKIAVTELESVKSKL